MIVGDDNGAFIKRIKGNMDYECTTIKKKRFYIADFR